MSNPKFTTIKLEVVEAILSEIFMHYQKYLNDFRGRLIKENLEYSDHPGAMFGFTVAYNQYTTDGAPRSIQLPTLAEELMPSFLNYKEDMARFVKDWRRVNQGLGTLFARGENMQDLYDLLPDEVHSVFGENLKNYFGRLTRTRPEAYAVKDNPVQYEAFLHQKELIFQYIGNQLIV